MDFLRLGLYNPSLEDLFMFGFGPNWPELMTYGKFLWTDLVLTLETTIIFLRCHLICSLLVRKAWENQVELFRPLVHTAGLLALVGDLKIRLLLSFFP